MSDLARHSDRSAMLRSDRQTDSAPRPEADRPGAEPKLRPQSADIPRARVLRFRVAHWYRQRPERFHQATLYLENYAYLYCKI